MNRIKNGIKKIIYSFILYYFFNIFMLKYNLYIPINFITLLVASYYGIIGFLTILIISIIIL